MSNWAEKFKKKLQEKEIKRQERKKNFQIYQEAAIKLFNEIKKKVKEIDLISIIEYMPSQSEESKATTIKALKLKCYDKYLDFIPEGINLDSSRGRIRIKHNSKALPQFVYLHLIIDENSKEKYPDNLIWVINKNFKEEVQDYTKLPRFDEKNLENLIESSFLE